MTEQELSPLLTSPHSTITALKVTSAAQAWDLLWLSIPCWFCPQKLSQLVRIVEMMLLISIHHISSTRQWSVQDAELLLCTESLSTVKLNFIHSQVHLDRLSCTQWILTAPEHVWQPTTSRWCCSLLVATLPPHPPSGHLLMPVTSWGEVAGNNIFWEITFSSYHHNVPGGSALVSHCWAALSPFSDSYSVHCHSVILNGMWSQA